MNNKQYTTTYQSPFGEMRLVGDHIGLTELWFSKQSYDAVHGNQVQEEKEIPVLLQTKQWLNLYYSGQKPDFTPPLHFTGTEFQNRVWNILLTIPYGQTMTYGDIAVILAKEKNIKRMSAQAVGGAVGRNKIPIIVPCHRVIGADGSMIEFSAGLDKKIDLLKREGFTIENNRVMNKID